MLPGLAVLYSFCVVVSVGDCKVVVLETKVVEDRVNCIWQVPTNSSVVCMELFSSFSPSRKDPSVFCLKIVHLKESLCVEIDIGYMELGPGVDAWSSQGGESCCILERDDGNVEI